MDMTIDVAAVVANFQMMTRIADGTGTPLDSFTEEVTSELRDGLGVGDLVSTRFDPTA